MIALAECCTEIQELDLRGCVRIYRPGLLALRDKQLSDDAAGKRTLLRIAVDGTNVDNGTNALTTLPTLTVPIDWRSIPTRTEMMMMMMKATGCDSSRCRALQIIFRCVSLIVPNSASVHAQVLRRLLIVCCMIRCFVSRMG